MGVKDGESEPRRAVGGGRGRCLILVPRGFDAPADLVEGLRQRGVALDEVGDAPAVMVALARGQYLSLVIVEPQAVLELEELLDSVRQYYGPVPVWRYVTEHDPRLSRLTPERERGNPGAGGGQERTADHQATTTNGTAEKQAEASPPRPGAIAGRIRPSNRRLPDRAEKVAGRRPSEPHESGPTLRYAGEDGAEGQASRREASPEAPEPAEPPEIRVTLSEEELAMLLDEDFDAGASSSDEEEKER